MSIGEFSRSFLPVFILMSTFFLTAQTGGAQERDCLITIVNQAQGAGDLEFVFTATSEKGEADTIPLTDGESVSGGITPGTAGTLVEEPPAGWLLSDVVCEGDSGLSITNIDDGISLECIEPTGERTTCTFVNVPVVTNIPTLSEWGMIAAAAGLGLAGVWFAGRRRRAGAV